MLNPRIHTLPDHMEDVLYMVQISKRINYLPPAKLKVIAVIKKLSE